MTASDNTPDAAVPTPQRPFLTVLKGNPTDEELGALTAVVAAAAAAASDPAAETGPVNNWGRPADHLRPGHLAYSPAAFQNLTFY